MTQVLITTADPSLIEAVRDALGATPIFWKFADTALKAAQILRDEALPDVIIIDMGVDRGIDFLRQLKSMPKLSDIPVLAVVDEPEPEKIKVALESGAARWLTVGFVRNTLPTVLNQVAGKFV